MKKSFTILCFFGTRPEAIKMAPVVKELQKNKRFRVKVALSAQHRALLDQVLRLFSVRSHIDLNIMKKKQSLYDITTRVLSRFEPALQKTKPDLVLVHGDTTTTLAGSLAAFYKKIPVGHVEAGLRTNDIYRPFPEEMNRRVCDDLTTLYFTPTNLTKKHLLSESHNRNRIFVTGNTVIDALMDLNRKAPKPKRKDVAALVRSFSKKKKKFVLLTAHRRENFGAPFLRIFQTIQSLSKQFPDVHWVYPVHPNPNVKGPAQKIFRKAKNIHLIPPIDYRDLVALLRRCEIVVTDSGGIQEEAPSLGKPVLVLRDVTERPEAVKAGTVRLVGANPKKIKGEFVRLLTNKSYYKKMANAVNPYGDGKASKRIRHAIEWYFSMKNTKPNAFRGGR